MFQRTKICSGLLLAFGSTLLAVAPGAFAQDTTVQRVEITGSSIKQIDAETSVPVTIIKADDLKKQGVTTVEQMLQTVSAMQTSQNTSQQVGSSSAGASFADLRGIGPNKTLVLLNGRRIANNAFDSSAPDLNMIPFAAIERIEVLRDGASALYGTDAIGGVINFITRSDFRGGTITLGAESPQKAGGSNHTANAGFGAGDLDKDGMNVFGFVDYSKTAHIGGTQRPFNTRLFGGLSASSFPANYGQLQTGNPLAATGCNGPNLTPDAASPLDCRETTSSFVDYVPATERMSGLLSAHFKINDKTTFGLEAFASHDKTSSQIAPVPYGALYVNRLLPDGTPNPNYPGNPGNSVVPNITLDPTYTKAGVVCAPGDDAAAGDCVAGVNPGFVKIGWRDLASGPRLDISTNDQLRVLSTLNGTLGEWDYDAGISLNTNRVNESVAGYTNGDIINDGFINGVLNPFGAQSAAGTALIRSAAVNGLLQSAKGDVQTIDGHASRDLGDWFHTGRPAAVAIGAEARHEKFHQAALPVLAAQVVSSTGVDPNTDNGGSRKVYAGYVELQVPVLKSLDFTLSGREDHYSDFGNTFNPKVSFRFQPVKAILVRGSFSTGFRAPSLYDLYSAAVFTNTPGPEDNPLTCPGGNPTAGHSSGDNCNQQFMVKVAGTPGLRPEKSKNATLGLVLEPANDVTLGLDLWSITTKHQIGTYAADDVFAVGNLSKYGGLFHPNAAGELSTDGSQCPGSNCGFVDFSTKNLGGVVTNGMDISAQYRLRAGGVGNFAFTLQSSYVHKYEFQTEEGGVYNNNVGVYADSSSQVVFRWQHNATVNWTQGPFAVGLAGHYKSGYLDEGGGRKVSNYATFDLYGSYQMPKGFGLTVGVRNVFDRDPPFSLNDNTFQAGYDPRYTDPTGRAYYVQGTYSF